jgi:hypothetical protein
MNRCRAAIEAGCRAAWLYQWLYRCEAQIRTWTPIVTLVLMPGLTCRVVAELRPLQDSVEAR